MNSMKVCILAILTAVLGISQVEEGAQVRDEPPVFRPPVLSPPASTSISLNGQRITVKYSAPSMRKRKIFGGLDPYNKVWRAGANDATLLETRADLEINGLLVPKGAYSLFVWLDEKQWQLIVNKQTGQSGLEYHQDQDLGRVPMEMSRPPKSIERYKMTLTKTGPTKAKLQLAWENTIATVDLAVRTQP